MAAGRENIWRIPAYLPYLQPALTPEAVASAERSIGFKIPTEYVNLLAKQNGGYIRYSLSDLPHDSIAGIGPQYPALGTADLGACQEFVSYPLQGLVPFDGDGHWHICLDYRENAVSPSIAYIDVECDRQAKVADSFSEYLGLLRIDVGNDYVLEVAGDIEVLMTHLRSALSVQFDPPDTWAHGYSTLRARAGSTNEPEWIWISPNDAPRGFVRDDDPRYDELKNLLPGNSPRFPEVPVESFLLSATDGIRSKVIEVCSRHAGVRLLRDYLEVQ